jgi:uncharacterized protein YuzB (UPF0349 family)
MVDEVMGNLPSCGICKTTTWRRVNGQTVCGACYDKGAAAMALSR